MEIQKYEDNERLSLTLTGRMDTNTASQLEAVLKQSVDGVRELEFDFSGLDYISSAGLRVLLTAQKVMNRQGTMVLRNVKPQIMDVFEMTGFDHILTVE